MEIRCSSSSSSSRPRRRGRAQPRRDWYYLPAPALLCVCQHLADLVDYHAFAGTCRAWRDVAIFGRRAFLASQPPLLCSDRGKRFYSPVNGRCYKNRRVAAIIRRLRGTIADVSHGYLVVEADCARYREKKIVLLNPFTNHKIGNLPLLDADFLNWVVLTAPPTSPDCVVVACTSLQCRPTWTLGRYYSGPSSMKYSIEYARLGDPRWTLFEWETNIDDTVKPVVSTDGRIYAWAPEGDELELVIMEFVRGPRQTRIRTVAFPERYLYPVCLVEPRDELLVVKASLVSDTGGSIDVTSGTFEIYQLDSSKRRWIQKNDDGLGNRALIMDYHRCMVANNPSRWGGQGGDIYFSVGHGSKTWRFGWKNATAAAPPNCLASFADEKRRYDRALWLLPSDSCC